MTYDSHQGVTEQSKAAQHRLDDAQALFDAGRWRGCMYMAGYAVECQLKAKLMRKFSRRHLTELEQTLQQRGILAANQTVFTHALRTLLETTGTMNRLRKNQASWRMFAEANRWVPAWRYNADSSDGVEARRFLAAVKGIRT